MNLEYFNILDKLINFDYNKTNKYNLDSVHYAKEFNTISISLPRQVGKSTYIKLNCKEDDLIVIHSECNRNYYKNVKSEVIKWSDYSKLFFKGKRVNYDTVWVDEPSIIFFNYNKQEFYNTILTAHEFPYEVRFIMLGTDVK